LREGFAGIDADVGSIISCHGHIF